MYCLDSKGVKTLGAVVITDSGAKWQTASKVTNTASSGFPTTVIQYLCFCNSSAATSQPAGLYLRSFQNFTRLWASETLFILSPSVPKLLSQVLWPFPPLPGQQSEVCVGPFL